MNANIFEKANQVIQACSIAYVGVLDEHGFPSVSTVTAARPMGENSGSAGHTILETYFATGLGSNKAARLRNDNRASVCFHQGGNNITLIGEAEILTDQPTKSRFWQGDGFLSHFPGGETDPNYCVVRIKTLRTSLWVDGEYAGFSMDELLTVQSYCGLLCNGCSYKEPHGCAGCIALKGRPFWGECEIAACCQSEGYAHCGECPDMPCDILTEFSCGGGDHGDNPPGARIAVCRAWAAGKQLF